jgi:hypothetical protein
MLPNCYESAQTIRPETMMNGDIQSNIYKPPNTNIPETKKKLPMDSRKFLIFYSVVVNMSFLMY